MARRRLTDLLREEVQKPEESSVEPVETTQKTETAGAAKAETAKVDTAKAETAKVDAVTKAAAIAAAAAAKSIAVLQTTLEQTQQREGDLKNQVTDLQAKLDEQQKLVKSLQSDLKRSDKLQKDLEEARKDALQLADANTKLAQEIETLKKPPSQPQPTAAIAKTAAPAEQARQRQIRTLSHPVFPNEPLPGQGSTLDTGWMD